LKSAPDCAFGNAIWDREMLAMARHAFVINPNPDLKDVAVAENWPIHQPMKSHAVR
jgi:phosphoserine phosphatase